MARDLLEGDPGSTDFLRQAEDRLAIPLGRLMLDGPEAELQATSNAQPAILFHSLALLRLISARELAPALVAGHSMGEFAGLVAAEALDPLDALAAGQVVISGSEAGLQDVGPKLEAAGARRLVRLPVSGAFHSPLMAHAAQVFAAAWEKIPLRALRRPQVFNADAQVHQDPTEVRSLMVGQLTGPVRWTQSIQRLQQLGADTYIEVGPRRTLTGLVKKILPGAVVHNIEDLASMNTTLKTIHG
jgi:[acyl-carrier-protein] S-malonyltransferase